jgi:hypothetical protein
MMFSYFPYARAFAVPEGAPPAIDPALVVVALAVAPFVFVALGFVSQNPQAPRQVLRAMGLLVVIALGIGLIAPVLGAATGFGVGGALTVNQAPLYDVMRVRLIAVALAAVYLLVLLVVATPAGVFAGGVVPLMAIGFADEFTYWKAARSAAP